MRTVMYLIIYIKTKVIVVFLIRQIYNKLKHNLSTSDSTKDYVSTNVKDSGF